MLPERVARPVGRGHEMILAFERGSPEWWRDVTLPPPPQPQDRRIEELFLKQCPPVFNGLGDPKEAETWVKALERLFDFLRFPDKDRLRCASFQLTESADLWWEARKKTITLGQLEGTTWEQFKTEFYNKYVPLNYRREKEVEFCNLRQGPMSVTDYDRLLCDMSKYAPEQVDTDEKMARKFRAGLRHEIRMALVRHGRLTYPESLREALYVESTLAKEEPAPVTTTAFRQVQAQAPRNKKQLNGQLTQLGPKKARLKQNKPRGFGRQTTPKTVRKYQQEPPVCPECNRTHYGICKAGTGACFACGQSGHFKKHCPTKPLEIGTRSHPTIQSELRTPHTQLGANPQVPPPNYQQPQGLLSQAREYVLTQERLEGNQGNLAGNQL
ncbi:uncharacterized protein LOC121792489 isoform X2 [Salvia splendens]|uniref:uncharacterized protein LOC121792489 isoform X2 n=1 Tax=Salvia splendens TaxID=180675 RepID=UPI001C272F2D|nr:uncharacterized protein LOC121792489 isoform X2 [Salvia splendens]XP_042046394.1 uncharacterized protein LOC121792489 isoform X2 [Salvia splendens]